MDLRKLKTLIDLVQQSGIAELEITEGEEKVRISRGVAAGWRRKACRSREPSISTARWCSRRRIGARPPAEPAAPPEPEGHVVKSPMVGTFYRSRRPAPSLSSKSADPVKAGETVCIIEAMKLLNEIEADRDGVIKEVLVENGRSGQPFRVTSPGHARSSSSSSLTSSMFEKS